MKKKKNFSVQVDIEFIDLRVIHTLSKNFNKRSTEDIVLIVDYPYYIFYKFVVKEIKFVITIYI